MVLAQVQNIRGETSIKMDIIGTRSFEQHVYLTESEPHDYVNEP